MWWLNLGRRLKRFWSHEKQRSTPRRDSARGTRLRLDPLEERRMLALVPELVADLAPGSASANINQLVGLGDTAYFARGGSSLEVWKSDGSAAGTAVALQPAPHSSGSGGVRELLAAQNRLYFYDQYQIPQTTAFASSLFGSDGTGAGTNFIVNSTVLGGPNPIFYSRLDEVGGLYYSLNASVGSNGPQLYPNLYRTTGTAASAVQLVQGDNGDEVTMIATIGNQMLFNFFDQSAGTTTLWRTDGTSGGTFKISNTSAETPLDSQLNRATINGIAYFSAVTANGSELWRSDGTSAGTTLVADINPGAGSSTPQMLTRVGNTLYFEATNGTSGRSLWKSDGTSNGTVLVANINPVSLGPSTSTANATLYFTADDGVNGLELWKSDGTSGGTQLVRNINPTGGSSAENFVLVGNRLFFSANDGVNGNELWTSDGTSAGTTLLGNINPNAASSDPSLLVNVNGTLFFTADNGTAGRELWRVAPEAITTIGTTLIVTGGPEANRVDLVFTSPTAYELTVNNGPRQTFTTSQYNSFQFNLGGGRDLINVHLSALADDLVFNGLGGSVTSSNYSISFSGVEDKYIFGNTLDKVVFNDVGNQELLYLLPSHGIAVDTAYTYLNEAIGFGQYTAQATGSNDWLFLYGDGGTQDFQSSPTAASVTTGGVSLVGQGYRTLVIHGLGGSSDRITYTGSAANELFTSLEAFSAVVSPETTQYFVAIPNVEAVSGGGTDVAVMYDTAGNDTFTANTNSGPIPNSFTFVGTTMDRKATGYAQVYAWSYFGGVDTANITNGPTTAMSWYGNSTYVIGARDSTVIQALQFQTVNCTGIPHLDTMTVDDAAGNDTLSGDGGSATMTYANGRRIQMTGIKSVVAQGFNGGQNRRLAPAAGSTMQITYVGTWV